ncbi:MAG: glucan biosynthesis protein [Candidatus Sumerlaeia bacterium]|nr:glucan biosynthesis protein [Candidatus Sumerlaeia bacterium]
MLAVFAAASCARAGGPVAGGAPLHLADARAIAARPYTPPAKVANPRLRALDYDDYRKLPFRVWRALWRDSGLPFEIGFYHPGYLFNHPPTVAVDDSGFQWTVPYAPDRFECYLDGGIEAYRPGLDGYAGFFALHPFDGGPARECLSFLGASYFRAIGSGHVYGTSARGLAIAMGGPGAEVFPAFTRFTIHRPDPGDAALVVDALLDSPGLAGAYRFEIEPGASTTVRVDARLVARAETRDVVLAPLTSMFFHDLRDEMPGGEHRPRVHDAEGLLIESGTGEFLYRPLANRTADRVSLFSTAGTPLGFGLAQRHTAASDYEDAEALYDRRPTAWVEPEGEWPAGSVLLLELHAPHEGVDNIGAGWRLAEPLREGEEMAFAYTLRFLTGDPPGHTGARLKRLESDGEGGLRLHFEGGIAGRPGAELLVEQGGGVRGAVPAAAGAGGSSTATIPAALRTGAELRCYLRSGGDYSETVIIAP